MATRSDWQYRKDPATVELDTRAMSVRVDSANEGERSIEAVLSTESPVQMYDWRSGGIVDEILLADGVSLPRQLPLLNTHNRYSLDAVLGSVRDIAIEDGDDARQIAGRLFFADGDEDAEKAWNKVRQGHITDVSIGYRVVARDEVEPGKTLTLKGRTFKAGSRRLRIATQWEIREASVVPIGADNQAKTRNQQFNPGVREMDKKLREYLESIGLRADASDGDAYAFMGQLEGQQREDAHKLMIGDPPATPAENLPAGDPSSQRSDDEPLSAEDAARSAVTAERQRVREIRAASDGIPAEVVQRAIDEGWAADRYNSEFLQALRASRMREDNSAPAGHSHSHAVACNVRTLAAGMMIGRGIDPIGSVLHDGRRARRSERFEERDADMADEFAGMSAVDLVRECVRIDSGRLVRDPEEAFRAAISGTSLNSVFTTNVYAELVAGWDEEPDSSSWCQSEDVPNFLEQEDISLSHQAGLDKHARGGTAKHATLEDDAETYKIARYSKQFVVDEQDAIDDRLGALMAMPREMGQAARRLRPDLVYSILLANAELTDGGALFNSTAETTAGGHANLGTTVLAAAGLKAAITAMAGRRIGTGKNAKVLNIRPRFLIVPPALEFTALELLTSARNNHTGDTDAVFPDVNLLSKQGLQLVPEARVDAVGVMDPSTGTQQTGSATNWWLAAARRTIRVAYRRGTNRQPQLRSFTLTQGQWGLGWDINMDIGAKAVEHRGMYQGKV
jgi:hypothetical protein